MNLNFKIKHQSINYLRYMDDLPLYVKLSTTHKSVSLTKECEFNNLLLFLYVLVVKRENKFLNKA